MIELHSITLTSGGSPVPFDSRSIPVEGGLRTDISLPQNLPPDLPTPAALGRLELLYRFEEPALGCFKNGFQSWSTSGERSPCDTESVLAPAARLIKLQRFGDDHFLRRSLRECSRRPGRFISHTYTYLRYSAESVTLAGSIDENTGYTLFTIDLVERTLIVSKDVEGGVFSPGDVLLSLVVLHGTEAECFARYWKSLAASRTGLPQDSTSQDSPSPVPHIPPSPSGDLLPTGWTSWYTYYTKIDENTLLGAIAALEDTGAPLDYFQIDDGYQEAVGDWLRIKETFPRGMKHLADRARSAGFTPGLWLAPFICEGCSAVAREHPEWILTDAGGRRVPAGWNPGWSGTFYALDTDNPELKDYLKEVFRTVFDDWGFELVKLDFLYAAGMVPRNGKTRGRLMYEAMQFLRSCAGDRIILGCGVPLGAAFFLTDICRIGSDVALKWEDLLLSRLRYPERVSTVNSLNSTVGRRHMGIGWAGTAGTGDTPAPGGRPLRPFLADPDVFILRSRGVALGPAERYTLFLVNALFGQLLFTSDDVSRYTLEERELFLSLFPFREKKFESVRSAGGTLAAGFSLQGKNYRVYANLTDGPVRFVLPEPPHRTETPGAYFRARTSEGRALPAFAAEGEPIELAGHESACFLVLSREVPSIAGSTGNLFPGSEILGFLNSGSPSGLTGSKEFSFEGHPHSRIGGDVFIRVSGPGIYSVNGSEFEAYEPLTGTWVVRAGA